MVQGEFRIRVKLARILLPTHGLPMWITSSWQIRVKGGASRCVAGSEFMRLGRDAGGAGAQVISPMISNRFLQVYYGILWYSIVICIAVTRWISVQQASGFLTKQNEALTRITQEHGTVYTIGILRWKCKNVTLP